jgi:hypothetical protein
MRSEGGRVHGGGHARCDARRDALGGGIVNGMALWALATLTRMLVAASSSS